MKKLLLILLILPTMAFCNYKMYDTKEGVFVLNEETGVLYKYYYNGLQKVAAPYYP